METSNPVKPFLKWVGGKRALLSEIMPLIPEIAGTYIEPFLGAGAVALSLPANMPKLLNDANSELINAYRVVRDDPDGLIKCLKRMENNEDFYQRIRSQDRTSSFAKKPAVQRAARFIYLNKTCFNGLYRVNSAGQFNVPFGHYKNPDFIQSEVIAAVSEFLNFRKGRNSIRITSGNFLTATRKAERGDFVYFDPPYVPLNATSSFTAYHKDGFGEKQQLQLREEMQRLSAIGVAALQSNSDTPIVRNMYGSKKEFRIIPIDVQRNISAKAASRGKVREVLILNRALLQCEVN